MTAEYRATNRPSSKHDRYRATGKSRLAAVGPPPAAPSAGYAGEKARPTRTTPVRAAFPPPAPRGGRTMTTQRVTTVSSATGRTPVTLAPATLTRAILAAMTAATAMASRIIHAT